MSADYVAGLLAKHRGRGCVVDSNLLLLYFVGSYDRQWVENFKRTDKYRGKDFDSLRNLIAYYGLRLVTTPNILTEVSNLSGQLPEPVMQSFFRDFAARIRLLHEEGEPSKVACENPHFERFGLTDCVIADISRNAYLVLTDDFPLAGLLGKLGIDVINFNHIRSRAW